MKWPMRALAITGMLTASWMPAIISGSDIRATPPSRRMSAGTRSSAITAAAPASSATFACSGVTTSMITPPLSISARPALTVNVASSRIDRRIACASETQTTRRSGPPTNRGCRRMNDTLDSRVCSLARPLARPRRRYPNSHGSRDSSMTCLTRRDGSGAQRRCGAFASDPKADQGCRPLCPSPPIGGAGSWRRLPRSWRLPVSRCELRRSMRPPRNSSVSRCPGRRSGTAWPQTSAARQPGLNA